MHKILGGFIIFVLTVQTEAELREGFRQVALRYHNYYRQQKGLPPLELDTELNVIAHEHAENLAAANELEASGVGYDENLWSYKGTLRSLSLNTRDAVNCWYTGSKVPGNTQSIVDTKVLYSDKVKFLGIGVGTSENYTVVVAEYAEKLKKQK